LACWLLPHRAAIFPDFPFAVDVLAEALHVAFLVPHQTELLGFGCPKMMRA